MTLPARLIAHAEKHPDIAADLREAAELLAPPPPPEPLIWYMRDNHTFRKLPFDVEQALADMREERDDGHTYGMLCSKQAGDLGSVHAYDAARWPAFEEAARRWLEVMCNARKLYEAALPTAPKEPLQ